MIDFIRGSNPIWSFVDLVGKQFDDTYWLWTLENTVPYLPSPVYSTPTGTPWTDPVQFLANGTLPNDIYFDPTKIYRLEIRKSTPPNPPTQSDPLIYLIENYSPNGDAAQPEFTGTLLTDNQLTSPQFAVMNIPQPFVLTAVTNPPPIEISPGWFLILTGTGNVSITQVPLAFAQANPTNAPYALHIVLTGSWVGNQTLRQRLDQNGMLWSGKYVSGSITALINGATQTITSRLIASDGSPLGVVVTAALTNSFVEYMGNTLIPPTANTNIPPNSWIDYQILIPPVSDIYLTSMQLVASNVAGNVIYEQTTVDRQIDQTFHNLNQPLQYKPLSSYLVGWDFPKNPAQFNGDSVPVFTNVNSSYYIWDQTIAYQNAASSYSFSRDTSGNFVITCAQAGQVAIIQYLGQEEARAILSGNVSVNVSGYTSRVNGVKGTVTLWATIGGPLPVAGVSGNAGLASIVQTLDANGRPTAFNQAAGGAWTEITRNNAANVNSFLLRAINASGESKYNDIPLNGFGLDNVGAVTSDNVTFFAIVVGFESMAAMDTITLNTISCVPGNIATRPAVKTIDDNLRDCEIFYEKSYKTSDIPGTVTASNSLAVVQNTGFSAGNYYLKEAVIPIKYRVTKRSNTPSVSLYSPSSGLVAKVDEYMQYTALAPTLTANIDVATSFSGSYIGSKSTTFYSKALAAGTLLAAFANQPACAYVLCHYIIDARLGVIT